MITNTTIVALMFLSSIATAQTSTMKIQSDLVMHPNQLSDLLSLESDKINKSSVWNWPELRFEKPYKTFWSTVQAQGPYTLKFQTDKLNAQEVSFELDWPQPSVVAAQFQVQDTIVRDVGGATVIVKLDGVCKDLAWKVANGAWKVKGTMIWTWNGSSPVVQWKSFSLVMNGETLPEIRVASCEGPENMADILKEAVEGASRDAGWLENTLKEGMLAWVENSLIKLRTELLKPRDMKLTENLNARWEPDTIAGLANGVVRVPGHVVLRKESGNHNPEPVMRTHTDADFAALTESGFILPRNTVEKVAEFAQTLNELRTRVPSKDVPAFVELMNNSFYQFWVWGDLQWFPKNTLFYFDLSSEKMPNITNGKSLTTKGTGVSYDVAAPIVINQWAPAKGQYIPYLDFRSQAKGQLRAQIKGQRFEVQFYPNTMPMTYKYRKEYMNKVRQPNDYINIGTIESRAQSYLQKKFFGVELPLWVVGEGSIMRISDVQVWKQSLRLPLVFESSDQKK